MIADRAAERRWWIVVAAIAVALTIFTCVDVRRRGRTEPLPPEVAAMVHEIHEDHDGRQLDPVDARREPIFPFGRSTSRHRTDLTAYTAAAKVFADGGSADEAYRAQSPRGWRYQYPPLLAALLAPIAGLATTTQSLLFGLLTAALMILTLVEARTWWRLLERPPLASGERPAKLPPFILVGAVAATALPALNTLQRGQVGMLVLLPLMVGFRLLWTSRTTTGAALGAALLTFPAVLKFIPMMPAGTSLLMALAAAWRRARAPAAPRRFLAGAAGFATGLALFAAIVPVLVIGPERTLDATRIFAQHVVGNPDFSDDWQFELHAYRNQSLDSAAWKLLRTLRGEERVAADPLGLGSAGPPAGAAPAPTPTSTPDARAGAAMPPPLFSRASIVLRALLVVLTAAAAMRLARDGVRGAFAGFGITCLATLVVSPVSWGHHFTMLLPAMLAVPAWLDARGRSGAALACSLSLGGAVVLHYAAVDLAGRVGLLGLTSGAVLVALLVLAWRIPAPPVTRERRSHTLRAAPDAPGAPTPPDPRPASSP